jgi:hypothetical protein
MATIGQQLKSPETGWQRIEDADTHFTYSAGWVSYSASNYSGGETKYTNTNNSTVTFKFYGTKFRIIGSIGTIDASLSVQIDGVQDSTINQYSATNTDQVLQYEKTGLTLGNHTVVLTATGITGSGQTTFDAIDIDASGFMGVGITVDGQTLAFNNVYYVDAAKGVDASGYGSASAPFNTVSYAVTKCASSGDAIYAKAGVHDVTTTGGTYGFGGLYDSGKSISFFGDPAGTVFWCDGAKNTARDHHAVCTYGANTKIYNIVFDHRVNGRTTNYTVAIFGREATAINAVCYNCVFKSDAATPYMIYDNSNTSVGSLINCSFSVKANFGASYSGGAKYSRTNVACNKSLFNDGGAYVADLNNVTYDSSWNITSSGWQHVGSGTNPDGSQANIGVYGGTYQWQQTYNPYTFPNTSGQLRSTITSMNIGDYIACNYSAVSGVFGYFNNLGGTPGQEIPIASTPIPDGTFFLIKVDKGLLIADRAIHSLISWDYLNSKGLIQGTYFAAPNVIPRMTSNTTPSGVANGSATQNQFYYAFDGTVTDFGTPASTPSGWVSYQFTSPRVIKQYSIRSNTGGYCPKNWTFEGSNDGSSWTVLDTQTNIANWVTANGDQRTFNISNTNSYYYYRLNVTAVNGGDHVVISELAMSEVACTLRSLTGGNSYADVNGYSTLTQPSPSNGAWPTNNEWDTYVLKSTLGGAITAGDDKVWHYYNIWTLCQDTTQNGTWKENGNSTAATATNGCRVVRGNTNSSTWKDVSFANPSSLTATYVGFRPVLQYS